MKRIYMYVHTVDDEPAYFCEQARLIFKSTRQLFNRDRRAVAWSVRQIRREQRIHRRAYELDGGECRSRLGYVRYDYTTARI